MTSTRSHSTDRMDRMDTAIAALEQRVDTMMTAHATRFDAMLSAQAAQEKRAAAMEDRLEDIMRLLRARSTPATPASRSVPSSPPRSGPTLPVDTLPGDAPPHIREGRLHPRGPPISPELPTPNSPALSASPYPAPSPPTAPEVSQDTTSYHHLLSAAKTSVRDGLSAHVFSGSLSACRMGEGISFVTMLATLLATTDFTGHLHRAPYTHILRSLAPSFTTDARQWYQSVFLPHFNSAAPSFSDSTAALAYFELHFTTRFCRFTDPTHSGHALRCAALPLVFSVAALQTFLLRAQALSLYPGWKSTMTEFIHRSLAPATREHLELSDPRFALSVAACEPLALLEVIRPLFPPSQETPPFPLARKALQDLCTPDLRQYLPHHPPTQPPSTVPLLPPPPPLAAPVLAVHGPGDPQRPADTLLLAGIRELQAGQSTMTKALQDVTATLQALGTVQQHREAIFTASRPAIHAQHETLFAPNRPAPAGAPMAPPARSQASRSGPYRQPGARALPHRTPAAPGVAALTPADPDPEPAPTWTESSPEDVAYADPPMAPTYADISGDH